MSSIVLELQQETLCQSSDIMTLLRKACVIAKKLQLSEFEKWIMAELNGYSNCNSIPDYRLVNGAIRAWNPYLGWIPVLLDNNNLEKLLCNRKVGDSISKIIELENKSESTFQINYDAEINTALNSLCNFPVPTQFALSVSAHQLYGITEQVKNTILEWTIKLENEGILGENMKFNSAEKELAKRIPQTVNNYYGNTNVITGSVDQSMIVVGNENAIEYTQEKANEIISEIEKTLRNEMISKENYETAIEMLDDIKDKVNSDKKYSIIKSAFVGIKDFLISVGASATVAILEAKMKGLF